MFSGKNGAVLLSVGGDASGDRFGTSVAGVGDLDGDGYPDIAVGASQPILLGSPGYVKLVSGRAGTLIRKVVATRVGDRFGHAVAAAGDQDGDKVPDVIVGATQNGNGGGGYATVYSGRTGSVIRTLSGTHYNGDFGTSVDGGSDLDGDGRPDLLVGAAAASDAASANGVGFAFSGRTGAVLFTVKGDASGHKLGTAVRFVGDVDRDGRADFAFGAPFDGGGTVQVFSGRDGKRLYRFAGDSAGDELGSSLGAMGDINDDGHADLVAGAPGDDNNGFGSGAACLFSGRRLSLWTDVHQLSLKQAGTQTLALAAGAAHAGRSYQLFGSVTGTSPGVPVGGVVVPLVVDPYTHFAFQNTASAVFQGFGGTLDGKGEARAALNLPSGLPAMADTTLFHAYLVFDAAGIHLASNPATLRLAN